MILDVREETVKTMFTGNRTDLMVRHETKRTDAETARWKITPTYFGKLEETKIWANPCKVVKSIGDLWEVSSGQDNILLT